MQRADVTPEWLSHVLPVGDACVVAAHEKAWTGGIAITSHVHRLRLEYDRPAPDAPASVIVKLANPDYENGPRLYRREVEFFRRYGRDLDVAIPVCFHASEEPFVLVLEDLAEAKPGHRLEGCDERETRIVLAAMADLHAAGWGQPIEGWEKGYPPERIEVLSNAWSGAWPSFLDGGRYEVPDEIRVRGREIIEGLPDELRRLHHSPRTLIHTDLHVENLLFDGDRAVFLDWQNAAYGPPALDLVNAVGGNSKPDVTRECGPALLSTYHRLLAERGVTGWSLEDLRAEHRAAVHLTLLGNAWFLSRFTPETEHDRRTVTLEWERSVAAVMAMG